MIEDNPNQGTEFKPRAPLTPAQKKILFGGVLVVLIVAAFFTGRYSAQMNSPASDTVAQLPTPQPMAAPAPIPESALTVIDFTGVSEAKKEEVLASFNSQYCPCGCKMTIAECIVKDLGCPYWMDHVNQLQKALGNGKKPKVSRASKKPQIQMMPAGAPNGNVMPPANSNRFIMSPGAGK